MADRPYQTRAVAQCRERYAQGSRSICLVAPTGSGKTWMAAMIVRGALTRGQRVLAVAPRHELVDQIRRTMPDGVAVETIQSLAVSGRRPPADLVILDEARHYVAEDWGRVAQSYTGSLRIGLDATPERADGTPLGDLFDSLVVAASYSELIAEGHLVPCDVYAPDKRRKSLASSPADACAAHPGQAIVFCATVSEAKDAARDIPGAVALHGGTSRAERVDAVDRFRVGDLRCLTSVYVLSEGFDAPSASVCVLARGAGHASTYLQMVGRVLRPAPGKTSATLVDLCGSYHDHGHPTEDREYSLEGAAIRRRDKAPVIWQCKHCGLCLAAPPADRRCTSCGEMIPVPKAITVAKRKLALQQARATHSPERRQAELAALRRVGAMRGYKPGWAEAVWRARYK